MMLKFAAATVLFGLPAEGMSSSFSSSSSSSAFASLGSEIWSPPSSEPLPGRGDPQNHVEFGLAVSLSANGQSLLTGAPFYEDGNSDQPQPSAQNVTNGESNSNNSGGGGVFFYTWDNNNNNNNNNSWKLQWSIWGKHNESRIGQYISLSPSGQLAAVHYGTHVQVYETYSGLAIGPAIIDPDCPGSTPAAVHLQDSYVAVSCPSFWENRGKAEIYQLSYENEKGAVFGPHWNSVLSIVGDAHEQGRFGWRIVMDATATTGRRLFRLAVSAPNYHNNTGLVRIYDVFEDHSFVQVGSDLLGDQPESLFGFDLSLSETSESSLAIGAPQNAGGGDMRGTVCIYSYLRTLSGQGSWQRVANFHGLDDQDRLGRNVAISRNAGRVVVSTFRYQDFTGLVQVYDLVNRQNYALRSSLVGETALERWGSDVAMSASGAVIASSSTFKRNSDKEPVGSVRVLIDQTPFCSLPVDATTTDVWFERNVCMSNGEMVFTEQACVQLSELGQSLPCEWVNGSFHNTTLSSSNTQAEIPSAFTTLAPTAGTEGDWHLVGCPCDASGNCMASDTIAQGQDLAICIQGRRQRTLGSSAPSSTINLVGVTSLTLQQGSRRAVIMDEQGTHVARASASCGDASCKIQTPVDASFFLSTTSEDRRA